LYNKELKRSRKNFLIWAVIVAGFTTMVTSLYPALEPMGDSIGQLLRGMPADLREMFGIGEASWTSILNFYNIYYGFYLMLLLGIYTASTAATMLTKEERDRTAEFLLTRPLTRQNVYWTKMFVLGTLAVSFMILQYVTAAIGMMVFGKGALSWSDFHILHLHGSALVLFFTGLAVPISLLVQARANFTGISVGLVLGSYFIEAISKAVDKAGWLGYISPFHYADLDSATPGFSLQWPNVIVLTALGVLLVVLGIRLFVRKDFAA
jgi:ABC-2 type transport system permease protein